METSIDQSSEEKLAERRAYMREYMRKRREDPEFRRRYVTSDRRQNRWENPEYRAQRIVYHRNWLRRPEGKQKHLISMSRSRAKKSGIEHTITVDDLDWPTHCPVLGIELNYSGGQGTQQPNAVTIDRWDNDKGYVPGNVRVISWRANTLKRDGTWQELLAVARYARYGGPPPGLEDIW